MDKTSLELRPVGIVRKTATSAEIEIYPEYEPALLGVEPGGEFWVLYWMHQLVEADRTVLQAHPRGDRTKAKRGVFALRSPMRPNPIGLTRVTLQAREGNVLRVEGLDAFEGTPVLDLKPC